jgi:hypothetical protein
MRDAGKGREETRNENEKQGETPDSTNTIHQPIHQPIHRLVALHKINPCRVDACQNTSLDDAEDVSLLGPATPLPVSITTVISIQLRAL